MELKDTNIFVWGEDQLAVTKVVAKFEESNNELFKIKTAHIDEAMSELLSYDYPGNIRELISIVERAAILSEQTNISKDDLFIYAKR